MHAWMGARAKRPPCANPRLRPCGAWTYASMDACARGAYAPTRGAAARAWPHARMAACAKRRPCARHGVGSRTHFAQAHERRRIVLDGAHMCRPLAYHGVTMRVSGSMAGSLATA